MYSLGYNELTVKTGEVDQDSAEDKWYTGFIMAVTVSSPPFWLRLPSPKEIKLIEKDYKVYLLTLALTACIVGLSFNMCVIAHDRSGLMWTRLLTSTVTSLL